MPKSTTQRGYGYRHQQLRRQWEPRVKRGGVWCARCQQPIWPGERWHLDHDSYDRSRTLGPSHEKCNCAEPSKRRGRPKVARYTNLDW